MTLTAFCSSAVVCAAVALAAASFSAFLSAPSTTSFCHGCMSGSDATASSAGAEGEAAPAEGGEAAPAEGDATPAAEEGSKDNMDVD